MAAREFHGVILNQWSNPIIWVEDNCDSGEWQEPLPSKPDGAGMINPGEEGKWGSESDGILTGTSGWVLWRVEAVDFNFQHPADRHDEFIRVNWSIPWTGKVDITFGVFRSDPREPITDNSPPMLEIVGTFLSGDGTEPAPAVAAEIAPYIFTLPFSFFADSPEFITHPRAQFAVRQRTSSQVQSPLTFPTDLPTREQMATESFRNRTRNAPLNGFVGGFPNFYETTEGNNHFGGTVFVTQAAAEWRDIPLAELGNVALEDFEGRMRAANTWASQHGFIGGFPTFYHADYGNGIVCGTVLIKSDGAEFHDVPLSELGNLALDDFEARFRATQDYATRKGFVGGFPTLHHKRAVLLSGGSAIVCGTVLLKRGEINRITAHISDTFAVGRNILLFTDPA